MYLPADHIMKKICRAVNPAMIYGKNCEASSPFLTVVLQSVSVVWNVPSSHYVLGLL